MIRDKLEYLEHWKSALYRKPLIIKGARQVGKTWLVREFGKSYKHFIEINFERSPEYSSIFEPNLDPERIINEILDAKEQPRDLKNTLLFFDESQESPNAIKSLRYFYEELPDLHIICTGSLLDFALENIPTGVGRITYLNLYPMTFSEFLTALGEDRLRKRLLKHPDDLPLTEIFHQKLLKYLHVYLAIGGMPEAVSEYISTNSLSHIQQVQRDLIQTYHDDFVKYARKHRITILDILLKSIPLQLGSKFIYTLVGEGFRSRELIQAIGLLEKARIINKVYYSRADGLPLHARINSKFFKILMLDIGLTQNIIGLDLENWITGNIGKHVRGGAITEAFVGQELAAYTNATPVNPLVYWHREKRNSSAEVDYVIEYKNNITPVEVKEGPTGRLKSLFLFLKEKNLNLGIKISSGNFNSSENLLSIPLYAIEKIFREN